MFSFSGRVPQGTCGLKWQEPNGEMADPGSGPARDLWIEILGEQESRLRKYVGSRKGPVD